MSRGMPTLQNWTCTWPKTIAICIWKFTITGKEFEKSKSARVGHWESWACGSGLCWWEAISSSVGRRGWVPPYWFAFLKPSHPDRKASMVRVLISRDHVISAPRAEGHPVLPSEHNHRETYRARIFKKVNISTNADLIRYAVHNHLVD